MQRELSARFRIDYHQRYPSKLPAHVQDKARDISIKAIKGLGLTNTTFNIEYFYNPEMEDLKIIEVNPRFSGQFGDIYEKVCALMKIGDRMA